MDKILSQANGGFPLVLNDIRQFLGQAGADDHGIYQALNNILQGFDTNFIVQGCVVSGTSPNVAITEGWILLDGELLKVDAQTGINTTTNNKFVKVITFDSAGNKDFQNGSNVDTYQKNRGVVQGLVGNLDFDDHRINEHVKIQSDGFEQAAYEDKSPLILDGINESLTLLGKGNLIRVSLADGDVIDYMTEMPSGTTVIIQVSFAVAGQANLRDFFASSLIAPPDGYLGFATAVEKNILIVNRTNLICSSDGSFWRVVGAFGGQKFTPVTTFSGDWLDGSGASGQPLEFRKDVNGIVSLRGLARGATSNVMFVLPVGFRPAKVLTFPFVIETPVSGSPGTASNIILQIFPGGTVSFSGGLPVSAFTISLDGISFEV